MNAEVSLDRRRGTADRRRTPRTPFVAAVREGAGAATQLALAQNLAPDGIELRRVPGARLPAAAPVALAFELPDGGALIEVEGEVVFERAAGRYHAAGLRFRKLAAADRARIAAALASAG